MTQEAKHVPRSYLDPIFRSNARISRVERRRYRNQIRHLNKKIRNDKANGRHYIMQTNHTLGKHENYILMDSGFSGYAVVGSETLKANENCFQNVTYLNRPSKNTYTFGAGGEFPAKNVAALKHPVVGRCRIDIVDGKLPFLVGRVFLRMHRSVLDFDRDKSVISGKKIPSAHRIPLSPLAGKESSLKNLRNSQAHSTSVVPTLSEIHEDSAKVPMVTSAKAAESIQSVKATEVSVQRSQSSGVDFRTGGKSCAVTYKRNQN